MADQSDVTACLEVCGTLSSTAGHRRRRSGTRAKTVQSHLADAVRIALTGFRNRDDFLCQYFRGEVVLIGNSESRAGHLERDVDPFVDPFKDIVPVTQFVDAALLVAVHPSAPASSVQELVTFASNSGQAELGDLGHRLDHASALRSIQVAAGVDIFHAPYKSGSTGLPDFLAGVAHVHSDPNALPHVLTGKAKLLALLDRSRWPDFPDVPLLKEIYPELDYLAWLAVFAPAGTPRPIVQRMSEEMNRIARELELRPLLRARRPIP
jgi:tripartite-type tricarboxylate transporter receptor subunit TctC